MLVQALVEVPRWCADESRWPRGRVSGMEPRYPRGGASTGPRHTWQSVCSPGLWHLTGSSPRPVCRGPPAPAALEQFPPSDLREPGPGRIRRWRSGLGLLLLCIYCTVESNLQSWFQPSEDAQYKQVPLAIGQTLRLKCPQPAASGSPAVVRSSLAAHWRRQKAKLRGMRA